MHWRKCKSISLKKNPGMRTFSYEQRLQILNLESFELRRVKADLTMYFKIINNFVDLNCDDFLKFSSNATRTIRLQIT